MRQFCFLFGISLLAASAQAPHSTDSFDRPLNYVTPIANAAYSGESVSVRTLLDGRPAAAPAMPSMKEWRDSQGRTRTERTLGTAANSPVVTQIIDPVAGYWYVLEPGKKLAHRKPAPPLLSPAGRGQIAAMLLGGTSLAPPFSPGPPRTDMGPVPKRTSEALGQKTIDGFLVEGKRVTTVYPAGREYDRPVTTVEEEWISADLLLRVFASTVDPRSGVATTKIVNLARTEPDAGLFRIPDGYTVVDETGRYTITF